MKQSTDRHTPSTSRKANRDKYSLNLMKQIRETVAASLSKQNLSNLLQNHRAGAIVALLQASYSVNLPLSYPSCLPLTLSVGDLFSIPQWPTVTAVHHKLSNSCIPSAKCEDFQCFKATFKWSKETSLKYIFIYVQFLFAHL